MRGTIFFKEVDRIKKYACILADPPWSYEVWSEKGTGRSVAANHYSTMTTAEICALPVEKITEKDCILFIWATFPNLIDCLKVIHAWGFTYKTCGFCWVKTNKNTPGYRMGLGYWTRANAEICLIATKGHPKRVSRKVRQIVATPPERHSKKPDCVRERIVELLGDVSRIELFAREQIPGWDAMGNEIDGRDIRDALKEAISQ